MMALKKLAHLKAGSIRVTNEDLAKAAAMEPAPPRTAPGQLMHMQGKVERQATEISHLKAELESAKQSGGAVEIPLDQLHEVPGRRRYMPPEKYAELRENLRHNRLTHPVVVRPRESGGFEIVAGHHRTDAYRDMGRPTIKCIPEVSTSEEADAAAFYVNLMQSDLTDFEKFRGFRRLLDARPDLTQSRLAEQAGVSESALSLLMSFGQLPNEVRAILETRPDLMGSLTSHGLAAAAKAGNTSRVVEAVQMLADGKLDQQQAVRFAKSAPVKVKPAAASNFKVKAGKATWCDVRIAKNVMRIEFRSADEAAQVQEAIRQQLDALAKASLTENAKG